MNKSSVKGQKFWVRKLDHAQCLRSYQRQMMKSGFNAVQCSGYSFSVRNGYLKESDVTLEDNLEWTRRIVDAVNVPVMADAEDGYGDAETITETVRRFMEIGVAGLNIEDQILGEPGPLRIIDEELMAEKIRIARKTAEVEGNPNLVKTAVLMLKICTCREEL